MSPDVHSENQGRTIGELTIGMVVESPLSESLVVLPLEKVVPEKVSPDKVLQEGVSPAAHALYLGKLKWGKNIEEKAAKGG